MHENTPDHSSFTVIGQRLGLEIYQQIFSLTLQALQEHGLLRGKNLRIDSSVIEANASLRALVNRNTQEWGPALGSLLRIMHLFEQRLRNNRWSSFATATRWVKRGTDTAACPPLQIIARDQVPDRPGCREPRALKRRAKPISCSTAHATSCMNSSTPTNTARIGGLSKRHSGLTHLRHHSELGTIPMTFVFCVSHNDRVEYFA